MKHLEHGIVNVVDDNKSMRKYMCSYLLRAEAMSCIHKMGTNHGEDNTVSVLGQELHALFKLVFKQSCVETIGKNRIQYK